MLLATIAASGEKIGLGEAGITALLGYGVVFLGLIALMIVVLIVGKIMAGPKKETVSEAPKAAASVSVAAPAPVAAPAAVPSGTAAPGSAGQIKLHGTPDREAAMIMAIVANKLDKPLNELRFISIKEVK